MNLNNNVIILLIKGEGENIELLIESGSFCFAAIDYYCKIMSEDRFILYIVNYEELKLH